MAEKPLNLIPHDCPNIRIAIAGMGKMGTYHLTAVKQLIDGDCEDYYKFYINSYLKKLKICGICDISRERLAQYPDIPQFIDCDEMLEKTAPHILIVATPPATHFDIANLSLGLGIHTFVEKPIVARSEQLKLLLNTAEQNGCRLMSGHVERYNPVAVKLVSLLKNVRPPAEEYSFVRTQIHDPRIADNIVVDKLIHDLDLAIYFFGKIKNFRLLSVRHTGGKPFEVRVNIEHENAVAGQLFVSWLTQDGEKRRQIEITQGGHRWNGDFVQKRLWVDGHEISCRIEGMIKPSNNQIKDEIVDFIGYSTEISLIKDFSPLLTIDEVVQTTDWLERINAAAII